eukprot:gnl/Spiro4/27255_TR13554_c0_g1_i1.p1 gnl/Spiro4/27255_TR13554_c0_g1~~gnl/Spiro4/27255_TR13554_c0_g1_i1.p1  ORF type:complete len:351 (+),score=90.04 gnl/Spiro4/27255_TR13554_c0_g1_i1:59-1111(+)
MAHVGENLLFFNFNQDFSCFSIGSRSGFSVFNCEQGTNSFTSGEGGTACAEMLFETSVLAIVGSGEQPSRSPRCLRLVDTRDGRTICQLSFPSAILRVRLNLLRLVVVLEAEAWIYDLAAPAPLQPINQVSTYPNPNGVCALSPNLTPSDHCYLAVPGLRELGEVCIYDVHRLSLVSSKRAHKHALSCLALNGDGTLLATVSEHCTVVHLFRLPQCDSVNSFRRGKTRARAYSLVFSLDGSMICLACSAGVYVFRLDQQQAPPSSLARFVPTFVSTLLEPASYFAFVRLRRPDLPHLSAINQTNSQILVVSGDGFFYKYHLDSMGGGECRLLKEYSLLERTPDQGTTKLL